MWLIRTAITLQVTNVHSKIEIYALEHKIYNFPKLKKRENIQTCMAFGNFRTNNRTTNITATPTISKVSIIIKLQLYIQAFEIVQSFCNSSLSCRIYLHLHHLNTTHTTLACTKSAQQRTAAHTNNSTNLKNDDVGLDD